MKMARDPKSSLIFDTYDSESPVATELRRIYHNSKRSSDGRHYKSFLITSSSRGEGKSTISSWLALTIGQFPTKKVAYIDADLRRPRAHKLFGLDNRLGLKDCLSDNIDPMEVIKKTPLPNGGKKPGDPQKISRTILLARLRERLQQGK